MKQGAVEDEKGKNKHIQEADNLWAKPWQLTKILKIQ